MLLAFRKSIVSGRSATAIILVIMTLLVGHDKVMRANEEAWETRAESRLSIAYARACLELAECELEEATEHNRLTSSTVASYDVTR